MPRFQKTIDRFTKGKIVLVLFVATNLVYTFMLTITIPKTMKFSEGMKLLDMMPMGYDWEYVNKLFGTLGENGRRIYLYNQIPVDMIYPFLFGFSYCWVLAYFLKKLNKVNSPLFYMCLLPIVAGLADYGENMGIITMLNAYPDLTHLATTMTSIFTIIKSLTTTLYFVVLIIVMTIFGIRWIRK